MILFGATCSKSCKADHDDVARRNECINDYCAAAYYIPIVNLVRFTKDPVETIEAAPFTEDGRKEPKERYKSLTGVTVTVCGKNDNMFSYVIRAYDVILL